MAPECWFCGKPIRKNQPAESLPQGRIAVHAKCVQRDAGNTGDRMKNDFLEVAA